MPGVHWPVHVFTDVSAGTVDILNINPLHKLHHAKAQQQIYGLGLLIHQPPIQLTIICLSCLRGTFNTQLRIVTLLDTEATAN